MAKYSSTGSRLYLVYRSGTAFAEFCQQEFNRQEEVFTHSEEVDVVKDLIVEGKVIAGDEINSRLLLDLPMLETESLSLLKELFAGELASPVSLCGLLEVTESSHAGETQN
jgi:hypothetical protein